MGLFKKKFPPVFCTYNLMFIIYKFMDTNKPLFLMKMNCLIEEKDKQ